MENYENKDTFEEEIVSKIDNKIDLSDKELQELVFCYEVDVEYGDNMRWCRPVSTIVELCGRFFKVDWYEGLTECQENEFLDQPVEVKKIQKEVTAIVTTWEEI